MAKTYAPKEIDLKYEFVEASNKETQQILSQAFDILFEETLKYLRNNPQINLSKKGGVN